MSASRKINEIVVVSGKGGTGKTSLVAALAALAGEGLVLADCDVDASDLHLVLAPEPIRREPFSGGSRARIEEALCTQCGLCHSVCRFHAIDAKTSRDGKQPQSRYRVDPLACEGCGVCAYFCPAQAIRMEPAQNGEWFLSRTRFGPLIHARLGPAEENSGKLVSLVRREARAVAIQEDRRMILSDGSPGIGCPVIASLTGADTALIVTEPTLSGLHDLERVAAVARHFSLPTWVCVNKWDINPSLTEKIELFAKKRGLQCAGRIPYDRSVITAQIQGRPVSELKDSPAARAIRTVWEKVGAQIKATVNV